MNAGIIIAPAILQNHCSTLPLLLLLLRRGRRPELRRRRTRSGHNPRTRVGAANLVRDRRTAIQQRAIPPGTNANAQARRRRARGGGMVMVMVEPIRGGG